MNRLYLSIMRMITAMVLYLCGGAVSMAAGTPQPVRRAAGNSDPGLLLITPVTLMQGERKEVAVSLENDTPFTAFQSDLYLPEGVGVVAGSFRLSDRFSSGHSLSVKSYDGGLTRIICYSLGNDPIEGSEGVILTFEIEAGYETDGTAEMSLRNTLFSMADARELALPEATAEVTVEKDMETGIEEIVRNAGVRIEQEGDYLIIGGSESGEMIRIYSLDGNEICSTMSDGRTVKVSMKPGAYILTVGKFARKHLVK